MTTLSEKILYEGVVVDLVVRGVGPGFGDLFVICGSENPHFHPSGQFDFASLADLHFSLVDDYFGVQTLSDEGDNVAIWLYPLVNHQVVHHHPGPFHGLRLTYCPLRNPTRRKEHFLLTVSRMAAVLPVDVVYRGDTGPVPGVLDSIRKDIHQVEEHWVHAGIIPGSPAAMDMDF